MTSKEQTVATYNATAQAMANKFNAMGARVEDIERGFALCGKEQPSVLEIGCGNGRDAAEIRKRTDRYRGMDISEEMIALARQAVPTGTFQVGDIETYTFPPGIDLIFAFASLLHTPPTTLATVLKSARQALKPNGVFYISLKEGVGEQLKTDNFGTRTFFLYTKEHLLAVAPGWECVWSDQQILNDQAWFTVALRAKIS